MAIHINNSNREIITEQINGNTYCSIIDFIMSLPNGKYGQANLGLAEYRFSASARQVLYSVKVEVTKNGRWPLRITGFNGRKELNPSYRPEAHLRTRSDSDWKGMYKDGFDYMVKLDGLCDIIRSFGFVVEVSRERIIVIPKTVEGLVNGIKKTLSPRDTWYAYQGNEQVIDANGRYKIVVGPRVLNEDYPDTGRIWADDFDLPIRIDAILEHKTTGVSKTIECIVLKGGKAHTYNKYPDNHPKNEWYINATASFDIENGLLQTGIVYPNSENTKFEAQFASANIDGSTIEFVGRGLDFTPSDYRLIKIHVYEN